MTIHNMSDRELLHPRVREAKITLRRFLVVAAVAIVAFLTFIAIALLYFYPRTFSCPQCETMRFEAEAWRTPPETNPFARIRMVDDLLASYLLVGNRQESVAELLGPASSGGYPGCDYLTWLGPERSAFALDSNYLCVWFTNGQVAGVSIIED